MECSEIIDLMKESASEKYKSNVVKMGILEENSIGVSTGDIRKIAKTLKKSNILANELMNTGYHEAKLLAVLLYDNKTLALSDVEQMMSQVSSWDLCDHLCKNLIIKRKDYEELITKWCQADNTYYKRAAFTIMASAVIHNSNLSQDSIDDYLRIIKENSCDEREHVKKAVSWALREIGKKDFDNQEKAVLLAHELKNTGNKAQAWIAKDALKELENLVKVEGRGRLISTNTEMGGKSI